MVIELLYIADCPGWALARKRLDEALAAVGRSDSVVRLRVVETDEEARALGFPGSPTILLDGYDPFPSATRTDGLTCRVYATPDGLAGAPTVAQLVRVLEGGA
ncbi:thioredoxin family protein [Streptomyces sp. NPDC004284]|uniref:thioredoxin family protein n=1 Tax=Streptomyces sp. NPDC004284 TaxID=3364695 RepID=UPI0036C09607